MDDRTTLGDVLKIVEDPNAIIHQMLQSFGSAAPDKEDTTGEGMMFFEMIKGLPLHSLRSFHGWGLDRNILDEAIAKAMAKE